MRLVVIVGHPGVSHLLEKSSVRNLQNRRTRTHSNASHSSSCALRSFLVPLNRSQFFLGQDTVANRQSRSSCFACVSLGPLKPQPCSAWTQGSGRYSHCEGEGEGRAARGGGRTYGLVVFGLVAKDTGPKAAEGEVSAVYAIRKSSVRLREAVEEDARKLLYNPTNRLCRSHVRRIQQRFLAYRTDPSPVAIAF